MSQLERLGPIDRTPGIPGSDKNDEDNEPTRVKPQESHPPGVVCAAHPGIGHNSDKDKEMKNLVIFLVVQ